MQTLFVQRPMIKLALFLILAVAGSAVAVSRIPSLKANMFEIVNPRIKEQKLVETLAGRLDDLNEQIANSTTAQTLSKNKQIISEAQKLVDEISAINKAHGNPASGLVDKAVSLLFGAPAAETVSDGDDLNPCTP